MNDAAISLKQIPRVSFFCILMTLLICSCTSVRKNYLTRALRAQENIQYDSLSFKKLDSVRLLVDTRVDSLLNYFKLNRRDKLIRSQTINQLYASFGMQLDFDRIYNAIIQSTGPSWKLKRDFYKAVVKLLNSANFYNSYYNEFGRIRRPMNRGDVGNNIPANTLQRSKRFLFSPRVRNELLKHPDLPQFAFVDSALKKLPSTNFVKSAFYELYHQNDRIVNALYSTFTFAGKLFFGTKNTKAIKPIKRRKVAQTLASVLKPFDLVLTKTDNQLASIVIPGYYGHVAIWLGVDVSKAKVNLPDSVGAGPSINKKGLLESVRSGVRVSNLNQFSEANEYLVLRMKSLTKAQKESVLINAKKQLKKQYDYNFDIDSPDEVNCTELVYLSCDFIHWKVSQKLGRNVIYPDDILQTAIDSGLFELVANIKGDQVVIRPPISSIKITN